MRESPELQGPRERHALRNAQFLVRGKFEDRSSVRPKRSSEIGGLAKPGESGTKLEATWQEL
jgi:hypothetical protein